MKPVLLIAFLLLVASGLKAQISLLNEHKVIVIATLNYNHINGIDSGLTSKTNLLFIHYKRPSGVDVYDYFNSGDTCFMVAERFWNKEYIIPAIEELNKKYTNLGSYDWVDKDGTMNISLGILSNGFTIIYKKL